MIDYRELLNKYMRLVTMHDGYIGHLHSDFKSLHDKVKLTEKELEILREINRKII